VSAPDGQLRELTKGKSKRTSSSLADWRVRGNTALSGASWGRTRTRWPRCGACGSRGPFRASERRFLACKGACGTFQHCIPWEADHSTPTPPVRTPCTPRRAIFTSGQIGLIAIFLQPAESGPVLENCSVQPLRAFPKQLVQRRDHKPISGLQVCRPYPVTSPMFSQLRDYSCTWYRTVRPRQGMAGTISSRHLIILHPWTSFRWSKCESDARLCTLSLRLLLHSGGVCT
jgi:hypothetical protein